MSKTYRIAVIPGDGIGKEVMPEGLRVLEAAARKHGIDLQLTPIDWASCDYYAQHGDMMPADWKQQLQGMDAILFGAVGWPATVPDNVSLWGSLLKFRREFDQYINLRPVRLFDGVPCPLAAKRRPRTCGRSRRTSRNKRCMWRASWALKLLKSAWRKRACALARSAKGSSSGVSGVSCRGCARAGVAKASCARRCAAEACGGSRSRPGGCAGARPRGTR